MGLRRYAAAFLGAVALLSDACDWDGEPLEERCERAADCATSACEVANCVQTRCVRSRAADGAAPTRFQRAGDCSVITCASGTLEEKYDPFDLPPKLRNCTVPTCEKGATGQPRLYDSAPKGTPCDPGAAYSSCPAGTCL